MDADLLPDDIHSRGIEYLTPCDVHSLRNAYPSELKYQASMKESLPQISKAPILTSSLFLAFI